MRVLTAIVAAGMGATTSEAIADDLDFAALIDSPGVYSLSYDICASNGEISEKTKFRVTQSGNPCPIWLDETNPDGKFGPRDRLIFVAPAKHPRGDGYKAAYPPVRIQTSQDGSKPGRLPVLPAIEGAEGEPISPGFSVLSHAEENPIRFCLPGPDFTNADRFFWLRLTSVDESPHEIDLPASFLAIPPTSGTPAKLRMSLAGITTISDRSNTLPEHEIEIAVGNSHHPPHDWSGTEETVLEFDGLAPEDLSESLKIAVSERYSEDGNFIADIVLLNWIELETPLGTVPKGFDGQVRLIPQQPHLSSKEIPLSSDEEKLRLFSSSGKGWQLDSPGNFRIPLSEGDSSFYLARAGGETPVKKTRPWRTLDLSFIEEGTIDYLVIAPEMLAADVAPLVDAHSTQETSIRLLTVEDCYDAFGNGTPGTSAIARAIQHWYSQRKSKELGYVLLAGDASYEKPGTGRNLIPTSSFAIRGSLCASDNPYACLTGDDYDPDIAIGRLPIATSDEAQRVVTKTVTALIPDKKEPPTECRSLWVVDHNQSNRDRATKAIESLKNSGVDSELIYASDDEPHTERIARIKASLFAAPNWVFYIGHGARHIWQTGGLDYSDQSSLFTSDILAEWTGDKPVRALFSITCDNAPFDHPTDDSLGERFVTMSPGGSLTFVGASWRIQGFTKAPQMFSDAAETSVTVGETLEKAKKAMRFRPFVESFNLLGDPGLPLRPADTTAKPGKP